MVDEIRAEKELQLTMKIFTRFPSGKSRSLSVLIDTGSMANLIREGLLCDDEFQVAKKRLWMHTASGQVLRGGQMVVEAEMLFKKKVGPRGIWKNFEVPALLYRADIEVDIILGYPWLKENKMGVFPHLGALARVTPERGIVWLWGREGPAAKRRSKVFDYFVPKRRIASVHVSSAFTESEDYMGGWINHMKYVVPDVP